MKTIPPALLLAVLLTAPAAAIAAEPASLSEVLECNVAAVSHPDDPHVEDGEALATCSMRLRGSP